LEQYLAMSGAQSEARFCCAKAADDEMMVATAKAPTTNFFIVPSQVMMSFSINTQNDDKSSRYLTRP
jgi:hypothetical protein